MTYCRRFVCLIFLVSSATAFSLKARDTDEPRRRKTVYTVTPITVGERRHVDMSVKRVHRIGEAPTPEEVPETWDRYERNARNNLERNPKAALSYIDQAISRADSASAYKVCYLTKAEIYCALSNRVNAATYFQQALSRAKEAHNGISDIYERLYTFYADGKQYRDAERFFMRELDQRQNDSQVNQLLGRLFSEQNAYDQAEPFLQKAMTDNREPFCGRAAVQLARNWLTTGQQEKAEPLLASRYVQRRRQNSNRNEEDVTESVLLVQALILLGKTDEAMRLLQQEGTAVETNLGAKHPATVSFIHAYMTVCLLQGQFAEAEKWRTELDRRQEGTHASEVAETDTFENQGFVVGGSLNTLHDFLYQDKVEEALDFADAQARALNESNHPLLALFLFQTGRILQQRADAERQSQPPHEDIIKTLLIGKRITTGERAANGALHRYVMVATRFPKSLFAKDACLHEDEILTLLNTRYGTHLRSSIPADLRTKILGS